MIAALDQELRQEVEAEFLRRRSGQIRLLWQVGLTLPFAHIIFALLTGRSIVTDLGTLPALLLAGALIPRVSVRRLGWLMRALILSEMIWIAYRAQAIAEQPYFASVLIILPALALAAAVVDGPWLCAAAFVMAWLTLDLYAQALPVGSIQTQPIPYIKITLSLLVVGGITVDYYFRTLAGKLALRRRALTRALTQRIALQELLLVDARGALDSMANGLSSVRETLRRLASLGHSAVQMGFVQPTRDEIMPGRGVRDHFRLIFFKALMSVGALGMLWAAWVSRHLKPFHGGFAVAAALVHAAMLAWIWLRPAASRSASWIIVGVMCSLALLRTALWQENTLPATLLLMLFAILVATLVLGRRGMIVTLLCQALQLAIVAARFIHADAAKQDSLFTVALATTVVAALCYSVIQLQQAVIAALDVEAADLEDQTKAGSRLQMALKSELAAVSEAQAMHDSQRFLGRARDILESVSEYVGLASARSARPTRLEWLRYELEDQFRARAEAKAQGLNFEMDLDLKVMALPEALRDSLLGSLISNALKYSPHGSSIFIGAQRRQGRVFLWVRDQGPGLPEGLWQRVTKQAWPDESLPGLGLWLAWDYARRMRGSLELINLAGGGCEARLTLEEA